ncbi:hypothetical protein L202_03664 [Cryptococcus amylolentus CBS 6039]|uniref:FAD-binding FR-type domain-containing protein n=2 Tax=Cryptococcus amylolentus TaxID=104669 RepID=A0A1E3HVZ1_9TREE|nr:hypothetical protein L202_03664 [Cryptococcus amylolentus CBS 6039]ODN79751.1 hypothetical protein L202_03664 [Cryptococcus amylolentus CBS 6039]ODO08040.1 hypothetical protein I350_03623 [Cryptococcus amylolentus CBS 6273]
MSRRQPAHIFSQRLSWASRSLHVPHGARFASTTPLHKPRLASRKVAYTLFGLSLSLPAGYYLFPSSSPLLPYKYSDQPLQSSSPLTPVHKLLIVAVPPSSKEWFEKPYRTDGTLADVEGGEIVVQHVMVKSPDIQIERPYTLINDPVQEKSMRMVVKRVPGGEVGRVAHFTKEGDDLGIRGPIPTFSIYPSQYDKIVMISTGTAITPFLQLLSKLSPSSAPSLEIIHALPTPSPNALASNGSTPLSPLDLDWANSQQDPAFLPRQVEKFGSGLKVTRFVQGTVPREAVEGALVGVSKERVLVLVCLPPWLMRPLCGGMTPNLDQGPVTGVLRDLGLSSRQVYKLE